MTLRLDPSVYEKAAELIEARGLTKGRYRDADGCLCTLGAVNLAIGNGFTDPDSDEPGIGIDGIADWVNYVVHLDTLIPSEYGDVPEWNDEPERTAAEVAGLLRETAGALRAEYESHYRD